MKRIFKFLTIFSLLFVALQGCENVNVPNFNDPNLAATLSEANNYPSVLNGAYLDWWSAVHKYSPYMTLAVAGNHASSSWGNFNMRNVGTVGTPYGLGDHSALDNTQTAPSTAYLTAPWYGLYGAIGTANDILKGIRVSGNVVMSGTTDISNQTVAQALFIRGLSYGYLGLLFDRGFIVDETTDLANFAFTEANLQAYTALRDQAVADIDAAVAIANANSSFQITQFNGLTLDQNRSVRLMNSYAAKFLALTSRTPAENSAANWARIATYTSNGINFDFAPLGDGGTVWWHAYFLQGNHVWMRLDQQVINMIDSNHPYPFPAGSYTPPATSPDARFGGATSWFPFQGAPIFRPERGEYFFSFYRMSKYQAYRTNLAGPMMAMTQADNDLLWAEALVRTNGNLGNAVNLINASKVGNGGLTPATTGDANLLDQIQYERFLEAYESPGNPFFDRRRGGTLGNKQFTQFPIPALELNTLNIPLYTFGG